MSLSVEQFLSTPQPVSLVHGKLSDFSLETVLSTVSADLGILDVDTMVIEDLDKQAYEDVCQFCSLKPFGDLKLVAINLTGASSKLQCSIMQLLEEPSSNVKFVLFSESNLSSTLLSRCQVLSIYTEDVPTEETKRKVLRALAATSLGEKKILCDILAKWAPEDTEAMRIWAFERLSGRFRVFSQMEVEGLGLSEKFSRSILESLETLRLIDDKRVVLMLLMAQLVA